MHTKILMPPHKLKEVAGGGEVVLEGQNGVEDGSVAVSETFI